MSKLSVVLITKNEEENIERCLRSVEDIADEIVVVDSGSTDNTIKIAEKYDAKTYYREFDNFAAQRNYSLKKAAGDWILSMDADETITPELSNEILTSINNPKFDAFLIPRKNIIFGKEIKYSRWSPDSHIWLFRNSKAEFTGNVHEEVHVNGDIGTLINAKIHYSHKTISDFISMLNSYTDIESEKVKFSVWGAMYYPVRSFVGRYILKQGFRDGWRGFFLSYLMAIYRFTTYIKAWEKQK